MEQRLARRSEVAQIFNLLYRRIAFGRTPGNTTVSELSNAPQIANLRYSRVQLCATPAGHRRLAYCASGFGPLLDFGFRHLVFHFPAMLLASRIIVASFIGRESAP